MEFIKSIIDLCNANDGFISAILAVMSIVISVKLARLPYLKKVTFNNYLTTNSDGDIVLVLFIANIGNCPLCINQIIVKEGDKKIIHNERMEAFGYVINTHEHHKHKVVLKGYNFERLNNYQTLNVIVKAGEKTFKYKTEWARG